MLDFSNILDLSLTDIIHLKLPYVFDNINEIERVKQIMCSALHYLNHRQRSKQMIMDAWEDTYRLYKWFFDTKAEEIRQDVTQKLKRDPKLAVYTDIERYIEKEIEALKLSFVSEVDVLESILQTLPIGNLFEIPCVQTNFTNMEFFCVMALYMASQAIEQLETACNMLDNCDISILSLINDGNEEKALNKAETILLKKSLQQYRDAMQLSKKASNAILEAQVAINISIFYNELTASHVSNVTKSWISFRRSENGKKSYIKRYGDKHKRRRDKAWSLFCEAEKLNPTAKDSNLIASIVDKVQEYSKEIDLKLLTPGNEIDTISRMIDRKRKELGINKRKK